MATYELSDDQVRTLRTLVRDEIERVAELDPELDELDDDRATNDTYLDELRAIEFLLPAPGEKPDWSGVDEFLLPAPGEKPGVELPTPATRPILIRHLPYHGDVGLPSTAGRDL